MCIRDSAHISRPQVARDADEVVELCAAAPHHRFAGRIADGRRSEHEPRDGSPRVAPDQIDLQFPAGEGDPFVSASSASTENFDETPSESMN